MTMVTLKDGSHIPAVSLTVTLQCLAALKKENYIALFDLLQKCKNNKYPFPSLFGIDSKSVIRSFGLMDDNNVVHDITKQVVLNAVQETGSGLSAKIVDPVDRNAKPIKAPKAINADGSKSYYWIAALSVVSALGLGAAYLLSNYQE